MDYTQRLNFSDNKLPKGMLKDKLYIGTPTGIYLQKRSCSDCINDKDIIYFMFDAGYCSYRDPIKNDDSNLHFICEDGKLINENGIKFDTSEVINGSLIVSGGIYNEKKYKIIIVENGFLMDNKVFVPFEDVFFCKIINYIELHYYNIKLTPLLQHRFFDDDSNPIYLVTQKEIVRKHNYKINSKINSNFFREIKIAFYENNDLPIKINCNDNKCIYVSLFLSKFFNNAAPIFQNSFEQPHEKHDINSVAFEQILKWMKKLVMENRFPDVDELFVDNQINIDEWIHICDYCNIVDILKYFFRDIKSSLENN